MPTTSSPAPPDRRERRRQDTISEALDHAVEIMGEAGVGGLTITEIARRMGVKGPSLYKYFPSLHAVYDALFARGLASSDAAIGRAMASAEPGVPRIRAGTAAVVRWCVEHAALAQLMYWRPVPGFEPSQETFAASVRSMEQLRAEFAAAVELGHLDPRADGETFARMLTVVISGLISQQMANEPGAPYDAGIFTQLTDEALDMFFAHYEPQGN